MDTVWQDLRYGFRWLRSHPGFTAVVVLTLALGIGANTAIFSVVNAVLLQPLPYPAPARLVILKGALVGYNPAEGRDPLNWESRFNWKEQVHSFASLAAFGDFDGGANLSGQGEPKRVEATEVTANFFQTLGVNAVVGRTFALDEERPGKHAVAVISFDLWRRRFGGRAEVVGQAVSLNGKSFTIVGVAPPGFRYPRKVEVWIPLAPSLKERVFTGPIISYEVFGRLKDGVPLAQARAEMALFSETRRQAAGEQRMTGDTIEVVPMLDHLVGRIRPALLLLLGAVGLVLLIACVNLTNLLLSSATTRRKEIAIRAALGAGRWRLIRQSLTESLMMSLAGGSGGGLLSLWLVDGLVVLSPPEIPRADEIALDARVLAFTLAVSLLTGVLVGVVPALRSARVELNEALKEGDSKGRVGLGGRRLRGALVIAQVALALMLLIGAGLLMRSFIKVLAIDGGFERENLLTVSLSLPRGRYLNMDARRAFFQQLIAQVQALPSVTAVGCINKLPLSKTDVMGRLFEVPGQSSPARFEDRFALYLAISPDYFRAMGIPLLQGRPFTNADTPTAPPVVIINETLARRFFPEGDAIGRRMVITGEEQPREIVGVMKGVRSLGLERQPEQEMFLPYLQAGAVPSALAIRTTSEPSALLPAVREAVRSLDKDLPLYDIRTMEQRVSDWLAQRRFILLLISVFAGLAVALVAVGLYGVMSYAVAQRTHEIGIRMALGAQRGDVFKLVLGQGIIPAVIGVGIGLAAALVLTRLLSSMLFGVTPTDLVTFVSVSLLLVGVALLACYIPARRAMKVDPMVALRYE